MGEFFDWLLCMLLICSDDISDWLRKMRKQKNRRSGNND